MSKLFKRVVYFTLILSFLFVQTGFTQIAQELNLSGYLGHASGNFAPDKFRPLHLRYFSYDLQNNLFSILVDKGDLREVEGLQLNDSSKILLNYFLLGVSLPDSCFWVNLRPDSADEIIDSSLARTDTGKILLEADLQLKKDTAKFTSPETAEGKEYWDKLYKKAEELFGTENITIPTLTRPWIVPGEVIIRETQNSAYIYKANLKVLLEQDHLPGSAMYNFSDPRMKALNEYSSELIRQLIIPKLTNEVNLSRRYAPLRQVFYSLVLARWFKMRFEGKTGEYPSLINTSKLDGLTSKENWSKDSYFREYQNSFKNGEYDIKEKHSSAFGQTIRSYFSGGLDLREQVIASGRSGEQGAAGTFTGGLRDIAGALTNDAVVKLTGNAAIPGALTNDTRAWSGASNEEAGQGVQDALSTGRFAAVGLIGTMGADFRHVTFQYEGGATPVSYAPAASAEGTRQQLALTQAQLDLITRAATRVGLVDALRTKTLVFYQGGQPHYGLRYNNQLYFGVEDLADEWLFGEKLRHELAEQGDVWNALDPATQEAIRTTDHQNRSADVNAKVAVFSSQSHLRLLALELEDVRQLFESAQGNDQALAYARSMLNMMEQRINSYAPVSDPDNALASLKQRFTQVEAIASRVTPGEARFTERMTYIRDALRVGRPVVIPVFTAQALQGGIAAGMDITHLQTGALFALPVKSLSFVPVGYDSAQTSAQALVKVSAAFQALLQARSTPGQPLTSVKECLKLMNKAIDDTAGAEGVFIAIDMDANTLRSADGRYYLGEDAKKAYKNTYVDDQILREYYAILATDNSRLIAIEHPFADADSTALNAAKDVAALDEVTLDSDVRFEGVPVNKLAEVGGLAQEINQSPAPVTFQGRKFLRNPETGIETRVQRVTLDGLIRRANLKLAEAKKAAASKQTGQTAKRWSWRDILKFQPKPTNMGTSGFRGKVADMRDVEPYDISIGFPRWLVKRGQYRGNRETGVATKGQKIALAADFRDSSPDYAAAAMAGLKIAGMEIVWLGNIATPNMALYCQRNKIAGIMITGSHTEGQYNGLKLYDIDGEVLNEAEIEAGDIASDRDEIMAEVEKVRQELYAMSPEDSPFDDQGKFKPGLRPDIEHMPSLQEEARQMYVARTSQPFPGKPFTGHAVIYWQHSTVAAPAHVATLESVGYKVIIVGARGEEFVALDTENMTKDHLKYIADETEKVKRQYNGREELNAEGGKTGRWIITIDGVDYILDGFVSSDGDGDRPVLSDEKGKFWRGDVTTAVFAESIGAQAFVQSLTGNEDARVYLRERGINFIDSSVGSPYHVKIIRDRLRVNPRLLIAGGEVNGGVFLGPGFRFPSMQPGDAPIDDLVTRESLLSTLVIFFRANQEGIPVSKLFEGKLDHYADNAGLIHEMPVVPGTERTGKRILASFTPEGRKITQNRFTATGAQSEQTTVGAQAINIRDLVFNDAEQTVVVTWRNGATTAVSFASDLGKQVLALRETMQGFFDAEHGFGRIMRMAYGDRLDDGIVMWDTNKDRFHVRPSGNAAETRIYDYTFNKNTERAAEIVNMSVEPNGILRKMELAAGWSVDEIFAWLEQVDRDLNPPAPPTDPSSPRGPTTPPSGPQAPADASASNIAGLRNQQLLLGAPGNRAASKDDDAAAPASQNSTGPTRTGGIDFRVIPTLIQPMGSFTKLNFDLTQVSDLGNSNFNEEIRNINALAEKGILPSSQRIKELTIACYRSMDFPHYSVKLVACLANVCKLEESRQVSSDPELKESLVIADLL